jgi:hypothetical protein
MSQSSFELFLCAAAVIAAFVMMLNTNNIGINLARERKVIVSKLQHLSQKEAWLAPTGMVKREMMPPRGMGMPAMVRAMSPHVSVDTIHAPEGYTVFSSALSHDGDRLLYTLVSGMKDCRGAFGTRTTHMCQKEVRSFIRNLETGAETPLMLTSLGDGCAGPFFPFAWSTHDRQIISWADTSACSIPSASFFTSTSTDAVAIPEPLAMSDALFYDDYQRVIFTEPVVTNARVNATAEHGRLKVVNTETRSFRVLHEAPSTNDIILPHEAQTLTELEYLTEQDGVTTRHTVPIP